MPSSWNHQTENFKKYIDTFDRDISVLDVGPGMGKYFNILTSMGFDNIDCVEIFSRYIDDYSLREKYNNVFNCDICDFVFKYYDLIIMGDVLEHITYEKSKVLLDYIFERSEDIIVIVPFQHHQGPQMGNRYEEHLQDDLTVDIMLERYPMLKLKNKTERIGFFVKNKEYIKINKNNI